jgi:hypothetical protein
VPKCLELDRAGVGSVTSGELARLFSATYTAISLAVDPASPSSLEVWLIGELTLGAGRHMAAAAATCFGRQHGNRPYLC